MVCLWPTFSSVVLLLCGRHFLLPEKNLLHVTFCLDLPGNFSAPLKILARGLILCVNFLHEFLLKPIFTNLLTRKISAFELPFSLD